jgi:ATP-dependent RNA helicase DeaD
VADPTAPTLQTFPALGLAEPLLRAIDEAGYEAPTPIQAATIPALLAGRDLIGQAQTGTGKTAAFGLPLLQQLDPTRRDTQALVLAPTRELAIQVAEALHTYARYLPGLSILPVYGGQPIDVQQKRLLRGVQVVVGTPGRVMDHLRRGALRLDRVGLVVLDEADEMLRMGFIEDVEWILGQAPAGRQTALFSATMPPEIRRIAERHLRNPQSLAMAQRTLTVPAIEQRYLLAPYPQKLEALTRILESEPAEAVLVFTRTKTSAAEVAEKLEARGYSVAAMHGDMAQPMRERVIERLRAGQVEIVVATDVAARGLDVERISHVINFDIPSDVEAYVHRIGRTGRAGRAGVAVVFVAPRERRMLQEIERHTGQRILPMTMPTAADVALRRKNQFKDELRKLLADGDLEPYLALVEELVEEGHDVSEVAAAAAFLARRERPLELPSQAAVQAGAATAAQQAARPWAGAPGGGPGDAVTGRLARGKEPWVRLLVDVGRTAGLRPADLVGALANEAGVSSREIGRIDILDQVALLEIAAARADEVLAAMRDTTLRGEPAHYRLAGAGDPQPPPRPTTRPTGKRPPHPKWTPGPKHRKSVPPWARRPR